MLLPAGNILCGARLVPEAHWPNCRRFLSQIFLRINPSPDACIVYGSRQCHDVLLWSEKNEKTD